MLLSRFMRNVIKEKHALYSLGNLISFSNQDVERAWQHDMMKSDNEYEEDNKICCDS